VNCATGDFWHAFDDLSLPGRGIPLDFTHTYNSLLANQNSPLGYGWTDNDNMFLSQDSSGNITVHEEGGSQVTFFNTGSGYQPTSEVLATLVKNGDGTLTFTRLQTQDRYTFSAPTLSTAGSLLKAVDRNGYTTTFTYTGGNLTSISNAAGRILTLTYNANNQIATIHDDSTVNNGTFRTVTFTYDTSGNLTDVVDVNGGHWHFTYDSNHLLLTMEDPVQYARSGTFLTNTYDTSGRVTKQVDAMGRTTTFTYSTNADGTNRTAITDPDGNTTWQDYQNNELVRLTEASLPSQPVWIFTYDPITLGLASVTDPNGHTSSNTWDTSGNLLSHTDGLGRLMTYTYDSMNDVLTITDPRGNVQGATAANYTTTFTYDSNGNLQTVSHPGVEENYTPTVSLQYTDSYPGDVTGVVDPNGHTNQLTYDAIGDLTKVVDAAGNTTTFGYDSAGRVYSQVSPKGNV
jgi:YD repeat-containing protein